MGIRIQVSKERKCMVYSDNIIVEIEESCYNSYMVEFWNNGTEIRNRRNKSCNGNCLRS